VKASGTRLVADLDLRASAHQLVDGSALGGADVRRGNHPKGTAGLAVPFDGIHQQSQTLPLDEGTEQVDPVSGGHLCGQFLVQSWLVPGVDQ
jgi:hypothetical protein